MDGNEVPTYRAHDNPNAVELEASLESLGITEHVDCLIPDSVRPLHDGEPYQQKSRTTGELVVRGDCIVWVDAHNGELISRSINLKTGKIAIRTRWKYSEFTTLLVHPGDRPLKVSPKGDIVAEELHDGSFLYNFTENWFYYYQDGELHRIRGKTHQSTIVPSGGVRASGTNGLHVWPTNDRFVFVQLEIDLDHSLFLVDWEDKLWYFIHTTFDTYVMNIHPSSSGFVYFYSFQEDMVKLFPRFGKNCSRLTWFETERIKCNPDKYASAWPYNYTPDTILHRYAWRPEQLLDLTTGSVTPMKELYVMSLQGDEVRCYSYSEQFIWLLKQFARLHDRDLDIGRFFKKQCV